MKKNINDQGVEINKKKKQAKEQTPKSLGSYLQFEVDVPNIRKTFN